jgi:hypothetical protein
MGNLLVSLFESGSGQSGCLREAAIVSKYLGVVPSGDAEVVAAKQKGGPKPPLV